MANIETIPLTAATETAVNVSGTHTIITNRTGGAVYASANGGIVADASGVMYIADGATDIIEHTNGTVYVLSAGGGKVQCVGTDYGNRNFKSAGGTGSTLSADGATITNDGGVISANYIGENLLDNGNFSVNQRGKSGTISDTGYFVDRWKLTDGTVTINADGTLTLNGAIAQILETAAGTDVTASSDGGTAAYDNTTKTFTITGTGAVISWAKLELGSAATPFVAPNPATELARCQRYYCALYGNNYSAYPATIYGANNIYFNIPLPVTMRKTSGTPPIPTLVDATDDQIGVWTNGTSGTVVKQTGFEITTYSRNAGSVDIIATKTAHGITSACLRVTGLKVALSADL